MINNVTLTGRLTKEVELKYTGTGIAVCKFTLAVNRTFQDASGEKKTDFVSCIAWRKTAEVMGNHLKKGSLIGVVGRIETGSFEGQDGKRIYTTDVVADSVQFLESKSASQNTSSGQPNTQQQQSYTNTQNQQQNGYNGQQGASYGNQQQQQYQQPQQQQNYTRTDDDPFITGGGPIEIDDSDLPF